MHMYKTHTQTHTQVSPDVIALLTTREETAEMLKMKVCVYMRARACVRVYRCHIVCVRGGEYIDFITLRDTHTHTHTHTYIHRSTLI